MKSSILDQFRLTVMEQHLNVYAIKVQRANGENVSHSWRWSTFRECLYSGSKTFTSIAVGICVDEGRLRVTDKVLDFFPEYREIASPGSEAITLRDLLHMASGKLEFWFGEPDEQVLNAKKDDWAELFFRVPVTGEPGKTFFYSNACTYMLGRVVEKVSGQNLRDFLVPRLFTPMNIFNPQWQTCTAGHPIAATGLYLTTDEYSRLGLMMLNGGVYEETRIVSENYLQSVSGDILDNNTPGNIEPEGTAGYGYQVWRCSHPGAYRADGMFGQYCVVFPNEQAVVTVTSHEEKAANDILRAIYRDIIPRL